MSSSLNFRLASASEYDCAMVVLNEFQLSASEHAAKTGMGYSDSTTVMSLTDGTSYPAECEEEEEVEEVPSE